MTDKTKAPLIAGFGYTINQGIYAGEEVTVVNPETIPDRDENGDPVENQGSMQYGPRKVLCVNGEGQEVYLLPRMLDGPTSVPEGFLPDTVTAATMVEDRPAVATAAPIVEVPAEFDDEPITDPMDPRLDHLRPPASRVEEYVSRLMPNGTTDVDFLLSFTTDAYRATNQGRPANVMLKGDTQSGKTMLIEVLAIKWAEALGYPKPMPVFHLSGSSGVTDFDLFGQQTAYKGSITWLRGTVEMATQAGGILDLDEVNAMGERVTSSLHPLADSRHHFVNRNKPVNKDGVIVPDVVHAHEHLWIMGTYNEGYRGMGDMNEAFLNRFRHITWGYKDDVERSLIPSDALRTLGSALREARAKNHVRTPVGTKALQSLALDIETFGAEMGLGIFMGLFKPLERPQVETIINDRSILLLLQQEGQ